MRRLPRSVAALGSAVLSAGAALVASLPSAARAQPVPARDLWAFPIGAVLEPAALAGGAGAALWNPAAFALAPVERVRFSVATLATGAAQGVEGQAVATAVRRASGVTVGVSLARATVAGLVRTETDPQALGDVPYASLLGSLTVARPLLPHLTGGLAIRWREGQADREIRHAIAADLGVVADFPRLRGTRLALSSFLWRPGREVDDRPAVVGALETRVAGARDERALRAGFARQGIVGGGVEHGPFLAARIDVLEVRAALLRSRDAGRVLQRVRSGVALHYARYVVGVAREEGAVGLGPLYQFTLSTLVR